MLVVMEIQHETKDVASTTELHVEADRDRNNMEFGQS